MDPSKRFDFQLGNDMGGVDARRSEPRRFDRALPHDLVSYEDIDHDHPNGYKTQPNPSEQMFKLLGDRIRPYSLWFSHWRLMIRKLPHRLLG
jgi:hypothetical protein